MGLFSLVICPDTTKFVINCQVPLLLWRRFSRKFKRNHFPWMQKVHWRLTCTALKHLCLKLGHLYPVISQCKSLLCLIIEMLLLSHRRQGRAWILAEKEEQLIARSTFMTKLILKAYTYSILNLSLWLFSHGKPQDRQHKIIPTYLEPPNQHRKSCYALFCFPDKISRSGNTLR